MRLLLIFGLLGLWGCDRSRSVVSDAGNDAPGVNDAREVSADPYDRSCRGDAGRVPGETCIRCTRSEDCPMYHERCNREGYCSARNWCETDQDCPAERPACQSFFGCSPCRPDPPTSEAYPTSRFCPSQAPYCVPDWESNGLYCATCSVANPINSCPAGTWCTQRFLAPGGECKQPDCTADTPRTSVGNPRGNACRWCRWYSAAPCLATDGACAAQVRDYCACRAERGHECRAIPSYYDLITPLLTPCHAAFDALEACVNACPTSRAACDSPP